jgi:hypothetical protein
MNQSLLNFKKDGCGVIDCLLDKETLKFLHTYTFNQSLNEFNDDESNLPNLVMGGITHGHYCDPVMEIVSLMIQPKLEEFCGLKLFPTYNRYRVYKPGNSMVRHTDRGACEISVSILLDAQYKGDSNYRYELFADTTPFKNGDKLSNIWTELPKNKGISIKQRPGEGFIYRGCDIPHWREEFIAEEGSYHTQLFCHYINVDGPYYPEEKYDFRKGLGHPWRGKPSNK